MGVFGGGGSGELERGKSEGGEAGVASEVGGDVAVVLEIADEGVLVVLWKELSMLGAL